MRKNKEAHERTENWRWAKMNSQNLGPDNFQNYGRKSEKADEPSMR